MKTPQSTLLFSLSLSLSLSSPTSLSRDVDDGASFSIFDAMGVRAPSQPTTLSMAAPKEKEKKKGKKGKEREKEKEREQEERDSGVSVGRSAGKQLGVSHGPLASHLPSSSSHASGLSSPQFPHMAASSAINLKQPIDVILSSKNSGDIPRMKDRSAELSREIMEAFLASLPSRNDVAVNPYMESSLRAYQLLSVVKSPMVSLPSFLLSPPSWVERLPYLEVRAPFSSIVSAL